MGKEKLLVTSNFSISHSVFKSLVSQRHQKVSLCGNGLNDTNRAIVYLFTKRHILDVTKLKAFTDDKLNNDKIFVCLS